VSLMSMTGFGRGEAVGAGHRATVEVRTVNHRFLDVRVHLPREQAALEPAVVQAVRGRLGRGRVDVNVRLHGEGPGVAGAWRADLEEARALHRALLDVQDDLGLPGDLDIGTLSLLADRFLASGEPPAREVLQPALVEALAAALDAVVAARVGEGGAIAADLTERLAALRGHVARLEQRLPEVLETARERLQRRLEALLADTRVALEPGRLEQEVAILADRSDVAEELQRLRHHLDTLEALLDGDRDGPAGRRLDFLGQELGREANTVASKVGDGRVAALVVELKADIERVREQALNVE